ncbi:hypothetical protein VPHK470_0271 [Vibrio phage K470]
MKLCCDFISDALEFDDITIEHKQNMATVDVIKFYTDSQPVGEFFEKKLLLRGGKYEICD